MSTERDIDDRLALLRDAVISLMRLERDNPQEWRRERMAKLKAEIHVLYQIKLSLRGNK